MPHPKIKFLLRTGLVALRFYCFFRQKKNKERVLAAILLVPAFFLLIPTFTYSLTMIQSFIFQISLVYGVLSIFWVIRKHYRLTVVNFTIYLLLLIKVNAPVESTFRLDQEGTDFKVLQFNVLAGNRQYISTISKVKQLSPDFISFQEVSLNWANVLEEELSENYPYHKVVRDPNEHQGIAVFSKFPLVKSEVLLWDGTANISGKIQVGEQQINFLTLHTFSPTTRTRWYKRNEHIQQAQRYVQEKGGEFLVLGDFNTVPWDRRLTAFKSSTDLVDSRKKFTPTYPTWNPLIAQIPIDYIFHSNGIGCRSLDSVKITSDHMAIMGEFQVAGL